MRSAARLRNIKSMQRWCSRGTTIGSPIRRRDNQGAWEFVSRDQKEALVQVVGIKKHANMTVDYIRVKGLKENTMYRDMETGRLYNSTALMEAGVPKPVLEGEYQAYQWYFVEEE